MELPTCIHIGGKRIRVRVASLEDAYGQFDGEKMEIQISDQILTKPKLLISILRHEMLHAHFHITGQSFAETFDEETIVRALDNLFFPAYEKVISKITRKKLTHEVNSTAGPQPE